MPLTLRLIFHGIRSVWIAALLALIAWLTLVPATQAERAALGDGIAQAQPLGLAQMRVARAMVHFAPEYAAQMLSRATQGEISPELAGMLLRHIAAGPNTRVTQPNGSSRDAGGAKFVQVD